MLSSHSRFALFLIIGILPGQLTASIPDYITQIIEESVKQSDIVLNSQHGLEIETPNGSTLESYKVVTKNEVIAYALCRRIKACEINGCRENGRNMSSDYEYFDYVILIDSSCSVKALKIYNYRATYGHEIINQAWLDQFIGYSGSRSLEYGEDIQAITGATISVYALMYDIMYTIRELRILIG